MSSLGSSEEMVAGPLRSGPRANRHALTAELPRTPQEATAHPSSARHWSAGSGAGTTITVHDANHLPKNQHVVEKEAERGAILFLLQGRIVSVARQPVGTPFLMPTMICVMCF